MCKIPLTIYKEFLEIKSIAYYNPYNNVTTIIKSELITKHKGSFCSE